jgi:rod shape-determining protein MreC
MASVSRRPGNSRRAQYGTFFGYTAGVLGALAGAALLIVSFVHPSAFTGLRGLATGATAPLGDATATAREGGSSAWEIVEGFVLYGAHGARMQRDLRQTSVELAELRGVAEENRRLKALLGLENENPRPVTVAKLVSATAASTRRFAAINAGQNSGVAVGMPVRSPLGLVGRVLEAGPVTARVLLVTDTESVVPVRRAGDGVPAFVQGRGDGRVQIRLLNFGTNPLRRGDVFVTSGSGGLYRPGIAVAAATEVTRDGAVGALLSDPAATDYVVVDQPWSAAAAALAAAPPPAAVSARRKR